MKMNGLGKVHAF